MAKDKLEWKETSETSYFSKIYKTMWPLQQGIAGAPARTEKRDLRTRGALNLSFICFSVNASLSATLDHTKWTEQQKVRL